MSHDALCPFHARPDEDCYQQDAGVTLCELIAKVQCDERAKRHKFWQPDEYGRAYAQGAEAMRAACIAAVAPWCNCTAPTTTSPEHDDWCFSVDLAAALREIQP
jgi:hypothetical protein